MAHFHTHFYFFLLLVILFSSSQIEGRFGKLYYEVPKLPFQSPSPSPFLNEISLPPSGISASPSPSPVSEAESPVSTGEISPSPPRVFEGEISPSPTTDSGTQTENDIAPNPSETIDNAYGLYGSSDFSNEVFNKKKTTKTTNSDVVADANDEREEVDDVPANGFNAESFKEVNNYNQNGYNSNYFKNGENYDENYNGVNYDGVPVSKYNDKGFNDNYNANGFEGRSDTRTMENGKYYYDVQNENKNENEGYETVNNGNNGGGYYGERTKYEFDSMDEYEREQGYPNDQKYYVP